MTKNELINEIVNWLEKNAVDDTGYILPWVAVPFIDDNIKYRVYSQRPSTNSLNDFAHSIYEQIIANRDIYKIKICNE